MASIAKLGFNIKDVKVLLNSEPHPDHGGGLTVLQQESGAQLWASDASADSLASGGDDPDAVLPLRALIWIGVLGYRPPRVDHRFKDGDTIRVGPIALTAHVTGGHTRGCTSWSFRVRDGDRMLNVVSACDLGVLATSRYPEQGADGERSIRVLRGLPADIWVTCHARWWGRYRKLVASTTAKNPWTRSSIPRATALSSMRPKRNYAEGGCTSSTARGVSWCRYGDLREVGSWNLPVLPRNIALAKRIPGAFVREHAIVDTERTSEPSSASCQLGRWGQERAWHPLPITTFFGSTKWLSDSGQVSSYSGLCWGSVPCRLIIPWRVRTT
jgi:hypothetical protein